MAESMHYRGGRLTVKTLVGSKRFWLLLALVIGIVLYWWWGVLCAAKAERIAREAGMPESWEALAPPPVPPEDNPEPQVTVVVEVFRKDHSDMPNDADYLLLTPYPDDRAGRTDKLYLRSPEEAGWRRVLLANLESDRNRRGKLMREFEALASYRGYAPRLRWQWDESAYGLVASVRWLCIRAWLRADAGDTAGALEDLERAFTIYEMVRGPRHIQALDNYMHMGRTIDFTIQSMLAQVGADAFSTSELERLIVALQAHRHPHDDPTMRYVVQSSWFDTCEFLDELRKGELNAFQGGGLRLDDPTVCSRIGSFLLGPFFQYQKVLHARLHVEELALIDKPLSARPQKQHHLGTREMALYHLMLFLPHPPDVAGWQSAYTLHAARILSLQEGLRLLIALKQGRALPDELPEGTPPDPLTGKPFGYSRELGGFRILSGEDTLFRYAPGWELPPPPEPSDFFPPDMPSWLRELRQAAEQGQE